MVPEGRRLFPSLSVEENLLIGHLWPQGIWPLVFANNLRAVPDPERAPQPPGHSPVWRATADGCNRSSFDEQPPCSAL